MVTSFADAKQTSLRPLPEESPNSTTTKSIPGQLQSLDFFRQQSAWIQLFPLYSAAILGINWSSF
ncbi:MAG: hypothetical protein OIF58_16515, partial [Cohaesibacter sp.]|nr:hypothetical protein [Cohaesibacter sp.]